MLQHAGEGQTKKYVKNKKKSARRMAFFNWIG